MLDKDKSGYVSRKEWLYYLCEDVNNTGKAILRGNLRELFNKYDLNNDG
jgi:Ca2+-binding EF-hand superfamily protein